MSRHIVITIIVAVLGLSKSWAQQDVSFSHYFSMPSFYNPAATSVDTKMNVNLAYANQMTGFENSPKTILAMVDLPIYFLTPAHSAGVLFMNDGIGLFSHMKLGVQYAYHHRFGKKMKISGGIRFALLSEKFNGGKADYIDSGDPVLSTSEVKGSAFDVDFGLRVDYDNRWYAGVSMLHLTAPTVSYGDEKIYEINNGSSFYVTGGYNIAFRSPLFNMQVDAILRTDLKAWRGDLSARLNYSGPKQNLYVGLGFSPVNSVTLLVGGIFHDIVVGYAYEINTKGVGFVHGNHEVTVGYHADLDLFKKGRNKHKSVRIL